MHLPAKKALILWGGWAGHEPELVAARIAGLLAQNGYETTVSGTLDALADADALQRLDLIVPCWTMGELAPALSQNICRAVARGVGLGGCHGGLCDSFRLDSQWQFMTGGQWVSHPGNDGTRYTVNIRHGSSPIVQGLADFDVVSEQYYLHVDPAVEVLATTRFPVAPGCHTANRPVDMPVAWTKFWGFGRVFYLSLGHHDDVFDLYPAAQTLLLRGLLWAGEGRACAPSGEPDAARFGDI
ncbi:MAG: ThuA domain-containing protein [Oscillospiraceae bacterium]|jgi:type 1 glutamine amidotransferase|nr:ThuA domain-containing protein [Oscillospiraceae bacterium]